MPDRGTGTHRQRLPRNSLGVQVTARFITNRVTLLETDCQNMCLVVQMPMNLREIRMPEGKRRAATALGFIHKYRTYLLNPIVCDNLPIRKGRKPRFGG